MTAWFNVKRLIVMTAWHNMTGSNVIIQSIVQYETAQCHHSMMQYVMVTYRRNMTWSSTSKQVYANLHITANLCITTCMSDRSTC